MSFESISRNRFREWISNHLVRRYILDGNFLCLYGVSYEVITPLDVLGLPIELRNLGILDGDCIVTQYLNRIINYRSEIKILKKAPKPHCILCG